MSYAAAMQEHEVGDAAKLLDFLSRQRLSEEWQLVRYRDPAI
jgi:hypothetical protein